MSPLVLAVNAGSGTMVMHCYEVGAGDISGASPNPDPAWSAHAVRHTDPARLRVSGRGRHVDVEIVGADMAKLGHAAVDHLYGGPTAPTGVTDRLGVVGHRIVHGGPHLTGPVVVTDEVRAALDDAARFAPLHNPPALAVIDLLAARLAPAAHVAVLDTDFHRTIPDAAAAYGGPASWLARGLRRYGFHGISHHQASRRASALLGLPLPACRLITAHFGGGCSASAVDGGRSVATTMGLGPNEGMIMATRTGSIDPGLITHLMRVEGIDADGIDDLVNRRSGLLGLTGGRSGDIGEVLDGAARGDDGFELAAAAYVHRACREIAALRPSLGGLDALVLTGSAIEGRPDLRVALVDGLTFLGIELDVEANRRVVATPSGCDLAMPDSPTRVLLVRSDEELAIAEAALGSIGGTALGATPPGGASIE